MGWNPFKGRGTLRGRVVVHDLPENKMFSVSLTLFQVARRDSPSPYGGEPPPEAYKNGIAIKEVESAADGPLSFETRQPSGFYYGDVGFIAYFEKPDGGMIAQVEHFWPLSAPVEIRRNEATNVTLRVTWPDIPLEQLGSYGTVHPNGGFEPA